MSARGSIWVFGYGSLVSRASLKRTLGHAPQPGSTFREAGLEGAVRRWNAAMDNLHGDPTDKHYVDANGDRPDVGIAFLGLSDRAGSAVNGSIVRVTRTVLRRLDRRERRYVRRDVTHRIETAGHLDDRDEVHTYVPSTAARATAARHHAAGTLVVAREYAVTVEQGFNELGAAHLAAYRSGTEDAPQVVDLSVVRPRG